MSQPKLTLQVRMVLAEFLKDPDAELYGREVYHSIGLKPGTVYPILRRLENAGLLASRWEEKPPSGVGRAFRCYYRFTSEGWAVARQEAAKDHANIKKRRAS